MDKIDIKNLTGKCLISLNNFSDEFTNALIYVCAHNSDGAMGFIINKRIKDFMPSDLIADLNFNLPNLSLPVGLYNGGPLEKAKGFIIHSNEYHRHDSIDNGGGIAISSSLEVLQDIFTGQGPQEKMIALGYAGWAPLQLEKEIAENRWLVTEATPELIFAHDDNAKRNLALSYLGIDYNNFTPTIGRA